MNITFSKVEAMDPWQFSFGALLVAATKLDTQLDKVLKKHDLTSKQWFLLVILDSMFEHPPTLKQLAEEMGSSYQNVKQVALKLEAKGLISIEKDPKDARALRIIATPESKAIWEKLSSDAAQFMGQFYQGVTPADADTLKHTLYQILQNLYQMD